MEMCYDGALVMPKQYAAVTEEEMTYVEGGGWYQWGVYKAVKLAGNAIFSGGVTGLLKKFGSAAIKKMLSNKLKKWVTKKAASALAGAFLGAINGFLSFSVGGAIAEFFDRKDGKNDNEIFFSRIF